MRAEAKSLHKDVAATFTERTTEIGIARDRAARDQYAAEQAAKSADIQVGVERKAAAANDREIAALEQRTAEVERRGDRASADELREDAGKWAADRDAHVARARQAELDAAQLREDGAGHQRRVTELNVERADVVKQSTAAEKEVDRIDEQVQLLEQARLKYGEADMSTDVGKRAALELEAEALVTKAGNIEVDRSLIRTVIPELPETTPGIDDDAGPLSPGSGDGSSNGSTNEDGTVASTDPDPSDGGTDSSTDETAAATPGLTGAGGDSSADPGARTTNTLDDDVFVDAAGGSTVNASASDSTFGATDDFGDAAGFAGTGSESIVGDGEQHAGVDSSGVEEPATAAFGDAAGSVDTTAGGDASAYEDPAYEAPAYEAPAYDEPAYGDAGDFAAADESDTGYVEPTYEPESYAG